MNTKLHAVTDSETRPVRLLRMHPRTNALLGPVPKWLDFMSGMLKIQIDLGALLDQEVDRPLLLTGLDLPITPQQNGRARPIVVRTANLEAQRDRE